MRRIFIRLQTDPSTTPVIMEMPGELPVKDIIPNLVAGEGWEELYSGEDIQYWFETDEGPVAMHKSLTQVGIKNGSTLYIRRSIGKPIDDVIVSKLHEIPQNIGPKDVRSSLPTPLRGSLKGDAQLLGGTSSSPNSSPETNSQSSTLKGSFLKK